MPSATNAKFTKLTCAEIYLLSQTVQCLLQWRSVLKLLVGDKVIQHVKSAQITRYANYPQRFSFGKPSPKWHNCTQQGPWTKRESTHSSSDIVQVEMEIIMTVPLTKIQQNLSHIQSQQSVLTHRNNQKPMTDKLHCNQNGNKTKTNLYIAGFCAKSKLIIVPDTKPYAMPFSNRQKIGAAQPLLWSITVALISCSRSIKSSLFFP